jgi:hypothetical protein
MTGTETAQGVDAEPLYEVVAPTGLVPQDRVPINPHPANLSGKTIGFVWDYLFKGPVVFDAVRHLIDERYTEVRYVDHEHFGDIHGFDSTHVLDELADKVRGAGIDAAVVAVGA